VNTTRKLGLVLAAVATALWAVVVVGFLATGPEDGVNIGAALLALLALPLSIGATITLIVSGGDDARRGMTDEHPVARRVAAGLGMASMAFLCSSLVLGQIAFGGAVVIAFVLLPTGLAAFVASSALFALSRSRQG
jgi:hypothetical protein